MTDAKGSIEAILAQADGQELRNLRIRLRSLIGEVVERIDIKPEKHYGRVFAVAQMRFHGTAWSRRFFLGTGKTKGFIADREPSKLDRDRVYFADHAKQLMAPAEMPDTTEIPSSLRDAAELWLKVMRAKMGKESYKVVPSKLQASLEVVGDMPTANLDAHRWSLWVRHLRMDLREGKLARETARVTYLRAREFVRWLISAGRTKPIVSLKLSGNVALDGKG